jgi:hypothetical protein
MKSGWSETIDVIHNKMKYPPYVEMGDENQANAVILPDIPGCYAADN